MRTKKYKLGDLVEISDEQNSKREFVDFYGINIDKEFMPSVANTDEVDPAKYKIMRKNRFVFSGMQTGRDECIRIGLYTNENPVIVSPAYTTFEVSRKDIILPEYLFMCFLSKEMDRYGWFLSDRSIRSNLDWSRFCSIELCLPDIPEQQKAVAAYNAINENLKTYTDGFENLALTCDLFMDNLKNEYKYERIGVFFEEVDIRNREKEITNVLGINIVKSFIPSVADLSQTDISKYKVIEKGQFAYSPMQTGRDETIRIALYDDDEKAVISPAYSVLKVVSDDVLAEFLMIWFKRDESDRYGWFLSDGSIRSSLELSRFFDVKIPIPPIDIQESIVAIYQAQTEREQIAAELKRLLKTICPILIKTVTDEK